MHKVRISQMIYYSVETRHIESRWVETTCTIAVAIIISTFTAAWLIFIIIAIMETELARKYIERHSSSLIKWKQRNFNEINFPVFNRYLK